MAKITIFGLNGTPLEIQGLTNENLREIQESFLDFLQDPPKRQFTDIYHKDESGHSHTMIIPADVIRRCIFTFETDPEEDNK